MNPNAPDSPSTPEHLNPGPFTLPGRDFLLSIFLSGMLAVKVLLGPGWLGYLAAGILAIMGLPPLAGWLGWRATGKKPFWGEIAYIATAGVLFIALSIPVYAAMIRAGEDL